MAVNKSVDSLNEKSHFKESSLFRRYRSFAIVWLVLSILLSVWYSSLLLNLFAVSLSLLWMCASWDLSILDLRIFCGISSIYLSFLVLSTFGNPKVLWINSSVLFVGNEFLDSWSIWSGSGSWVWRRGYLLGKRHSKQSEHRTTSKQSFLVCYRL